MFRGMCQDSQDEPGVYKDYQWTEVVEWRCEQLLCLAFSSAVFSFDGTLDQYRAFCRNAYMHAS